MKRSNQEFFAMCSRGSQWLGQKDECEWLDVAQNCAKAFWMNFTQKELRRLKNWFFHHFLSAEQVIMEVHLCLNSVPKVFVTIEQGHDRRRLHACMFVAVFILQWPDLLACNFPMASTGFHCLEFVLSDLH